MRGQACHGGRLPGLRLSARPACAPARTLPQGDRLQPFSACGRSHDLPMGRRAVSLAEGSELRHGTEIGKTEPGSRLSLHPLLFLVVYTAKHPQNIKTKIKVMKKCPYCGTQIGDSAFFCEVCGRRVSQGKVYVPDSSVTYWVSVMQVPIAKLAIILFFISILGGVFYASYSSKNANRLNTYREGTAFSFYKVSGLRRCLLTSNQFFAVGLSAYDWCMSTINYNKVKDDLLCNRDLSPDEIIEALNEAELKRNKQKGEAIGNTAGALLLGGMLSCMPGSAFGTWIGGAIVEKWYGSSIY